MKKARSFESLRNGSLKLWVSPFVTCAFLLSVFLYCMCGPFCSSAEAGPVGDEIPAVQSGCCSSHAPVQETPSSSGCCKHEPGETHCEDDVAEDALQLTESSIPIFSPRAELIEILQPETVHSTVRFGRAAALAVPIAPAYIQFQSFLI